MQKCLILHLNLFISNAAAQPVSPRTQSSRRESKEVRVQVILLTELVRDGDASEVLAPVALHGINVEEDGQGGEQSYENQQEYADLDPLAIHVRAPKTETAEKCNIHVFIFLRKFVCQCKSHTDLMYGKKAKDRKNPETKPQTWAKLSIQGSKPKEKKNTEMAKSFPNARHGRSRICQL